MLAIFSAALGIKGFLVPNGFIDGGITGISMLTSHIFSINLSVLIFIINLPFILLAFKHIGRNFAIYSALSIVGLSIFLHFYEFPCFTHDKILAAFFGGIFIGAGIGLSIRAGAVLDGTEILALILSRKSSVTVGEVILFINVVIFSCGYYFLGVEATMYSILTYFAASKTIDYLLHGIEEYNGMLIISEKSDEIKKQIVEKTDRGVTIFKGKGGYYQEEKEIVFCLVTRLELGRFKELVINIDPKAFIVVQSINEASGGMIKKPPHERV